MWEHLVKSVLPSALWSGAVPVDFCPKTVFRSWVRVNGCTHIPAWEHEILHSVWLTAEMVDQSVMVYWQSCVEWAILEDLIFLHPRIGESTAIPKTGALPLELDTDIHTTPSYTHGRGIMLCDPSNVVTVVSSPLVPSGNEWCIYGTAASTPCPMSLQCFFLWCVDVFHYPASSSPMLVHHSFKFSLQPVIGGLRSWLQFAGRPLGGLGLDFWFRDCTSRERVTPHIPEGTIWCLGIIDICLCLQTCCIDNVDSSLWQRVQYLSVLI